MKTEILLVNTSGMHNVVRVDCRIYVSISPINVTRRCVLESVDSQLICW